MKKFLTLTSLLLLTLTALSQGNISSNKDGSKVSLDVMRAMIKDIVRGEECDSESVKLYNTVNLYEQVIRGQDSMIQRLNKEKENLQTIIFNRETEASLHQVKTVVDAENIRNLNEAYNTLYQNYNAALKKIGGLKTGSKIKTGIIAALIAKILFFK